MHDNWQVRYATEILNPNIEEICESWYYISLSCQKKKLYITGLFAVFFFIYLKLIFELYTEELVGLFHYFQNSFSYCVDSYTRYFVYQIYFVEFSNFIKCITISFANSSRSIWSNISEKTKTIVYSLLKQNNM